MNVALLTGNFPPEAFGGTEMVVAALGRALEDFGDRVVVICSSDEPHEGRDVSEEDWERLPVRRRPLVGSTLRYRAADRTPA